MQQRQWNPNWWWVPNVSLTCSCSDLPCTDLDIGIIHHPMCTVGYSDDNRGVEDFFGPLTLKEEEMVPVDVQGRSL